MKKAIVMITAIILAIPAFAQSRIYRVVIVRLDGTSQKGALVGLNDSSISVIPLGEAKASTPKESVTIREFPVRSISELKIRNVQNLKTGIIAGGIIGGIAGGIIGSSAYTPCDDTQSSFGLTDCDFETMDQATTTVLGIVLGMEVGGALGLAIGSSNHKFPIAGQMSNYQQMKSLLEKYVLKL